MCSCGGEEGDGHQRALPLPATSLTKCYYPVWLLSSTFSGKQLHFHLIDKETKSVLKLTIGTLDT